MPRRPERRIRIDYVPGVRPRAVPPDEATTPVSPNSPAPSETFIVFSTDPGANANPFAILEPSTRRRLRLIRLKALDEDGAAAAAFLEVFYGQTPPNPGVTTSVQYSLPNSTVAKGTWTEGAGDADADAHDELDEGFGANRGDGDGPDDAATYWSAASSASGDLELGIENITDPGHDTGHTIRVRAQITDSFSAPEFTIVLKKDSTGATIASKQITMSDLDEWATITWDLTSAEAAGIDDYADLRITIDPHLGASSGRSLDISAIEMQILNPAQHTERADATKLIDILHIPISGEDATRTWAKSAGPRGRLDEALYGRWRAAPSASYIFIIEFTEEN